MNLRRDAARSRRTQSRHQTLTARGYALNARALKAVRRPRQAGAPTTSRDIAFPAKAVSIPLNRVPIFTSTHRGVHTTNHITSNRKLRYARTSPTTIPLAIRLS